MLYRTTNEEKEGQRKEGESGSREKGSTKQKKKWERKRWFYCYLLKSCHSTELLKLQISRNQAKELMLFEGREPHWGMWGCEESVIKLQAAWEHKTPARPQGYFLMHSSAGGLCVCE